jgi:choline dehydrogenase-like flavoprotein
MMSHPDDLKAAIASVQLCREIGNSALLRPFAKREMMPGNLKGAELENFIRDSVVTYWHQTCTAKMGRDSTSVVDRNLKVYGIENLSIADGSIMRRVLLEALRRLGLKIHGMLVLKLAPSGSNCLRSARWAFIWSNQAFYR